MYKEYLHSRSNYLSGNFCMLVFKAMASALILIVLADGRPKD